MKDKNNKTIHDTEKPVKLTDILITNSSNENDIIFDPFMGIGGCAISAIKNKRRFIGCEIEEKFYNESVHRINNIKN